MYWVQVRPLLENEGVVSCEECVSVVGEDQLILGGDRVFRFDRVFTPTTCQVGREKFFTTLN